MTETIMREQKLRMGLDVGDSACLLASSGWLLYNTILWNNLVFGTNPGY